MFEPSLMVINFAESTQDEARKLAILGASPGTAVMALTQSRGRGRMGAQWVSPPGKNLAISVILRPTVEPREAPILGMLVSIVVADVVDSLCEPFRACVKWPNDVLINKRKIAGILSEAQITNGNLDFVIVGIGLNVNSQLSDFPADISEFLTSCSIMTGRSFDLREVAQTVLNRMKVFVNRFECEGSGFVSLDWQERWPHKNQLICRDGLEGTAVGVDTDGALLVRGLDGERFKIISGEVVLGKSGAITR
jgi:BirA family biotin operon repressor/biotin-[acetyl-CoA-carboxylase] ligase